MAWLNRKTGMSLLLAWSALACGCMHSPINDGLGPHPSSVASETFKDYTLPTNPLLESQPSSSLPQPTNHRLARLQQEEQPSQSGIQIKQVSYANAPPVAASTTSYMVRICAWVNGKPVLMGDLINEAAKELYDLQKVPEPAHSVQRRELLKKKLQHLIDQEVIYQEAMRKLEQNPVFLDKITKEADKQFEKRFQIMLERTGLSETELKKQLDMQRTSLAALRRQTVRDFVVATYIQSRISPTLDQIGHREIREYYQTHLNEFQKVDRVEWEDIFIAAGTKRCPTVAHARQFAEHILSRLKAGEPFSDLVQYDDGVSKLRGGKGYGQRQGEIKPPELEPYLFQMKAGQIGPIVELSTGVHIFRVVEREYGGQIPFNQEVQDQIRSKLREQIGQREIQRIIRELSERAVIEVNPEALQ